MDPERLSQLMDGEWHELNPSECIQGVCGDQSLRDTWLRYHLIRDVMKNEPVTSDSQLVSRICAAIAEEPGYSNITSIAWQSPAISHGAPLSATVVPGSGDAALEQGAASEISAQAAPAVDLSGTANQSMSAKAVAPAVFPRSLFGTGVAGFALAASVAAVTVLGMNLWQTRSADSIQTMAVNSTASTATSTSAGTSSVDGSGAFSTQIVGQPLPEVDFVANTGAYWVSPESAQRVNDEERLNMFLSQHIENSPTADREGLLPYSRLVGYDERGQGR